MTGGTTLPGAVDWATISSLATAAGTLVLAVATFAAVRSANRSSRAAERSLLVGIRPLVVPSRLGDPPEKVGFADQHWVSVGGGRASVEVTDEAVYLVVPLRNTGAGMAVLHGWDAHVGRMTMGDTTRPDPDGFRRLTRDLFVASGDTGFWQGAVRDRSDPLFIEIRHRLDEEAAITLDILYGDLEGGQRSITRMTLSEMGEHGWLATAARHWNLDVPDPR